jgi:hypothetical protein
VLVREREREREREGGSQKKNIARIKLFQILNKNVICTWTFSE